MGLLTLGKALEAASTTAISGYIREHGISQFLSTYQRVSSIVDDELKFGDEIECGIYVVDPLNKTVKLSVRSRQVLMNPIELLLELLQQKEVLLAHQSEGCTWHPEFGNWMIESTPSRPYGNYASDLLRVERNMVLRRRRLISALAEDEIAPTVTCFPLLGVGEFIHLPQPFHAPYSQSDYLPDYIVNPHPRFAALTSNIRTRRGEKVDIRMPLFRDVNTPEFHRFNISSQYYTNQQIDLKPDPSMPSSSHNASTNGYGNGHSNGSSVSAIPTAASTHVSHSVHPGSSGYSGPVEVDTDIHMDAMGFGMGMCCLQVTFQARDIDESRYIYDQLAVLAPIMLAMTAATPFFKGRIADVDVRWNTIAQSVDDRTPAERGLVPENELDTHANPQMAGQGIRRIPKSRYDSVSTYIYHCKGEAACKRTFEIYNDVPCPVDEGTKTRLLEAGLDENLAHHLSHLFIRDPLVVFEEKINLDDAKSMEHFENIQSTNWQTCRWKPPPPENSPDDPHIGWRTEFRSMEVQLTDFENAAFTVFVVLVTRVILAFDLALYIPLSKVDENMHRAHQRDAIHTQKFFFRKHMAPPPSTGSSATGKSTSGISNRDESIETIEENCEEMTMDEIFNGKDCYYPGLIPLAYAYLDYINTDPETRKRVDQYLQFISKRAKGHLVTTATWMRRFVSQHSAYNRDSFITQEIAHDLLLTCKQIGEGSVGCPEILGDVIIDRVRSEDAYGQVLSGRLPTEERRKLIKRLVKRARKNRPDSIARGTAEDIPGSGSDSETDTPGTYVNISDAIKSQCEKCEDKTHAHHKA